MTDDNLNDLLPFWEEAVKAYERECEHPLDLVSEDEQPHNVDDLLRLIDKKSADFSSFRDRHSKLFSKLKRFVEPIATTGTLVSSILGSSNPFGAPVAIVLTSVLHLVSVSCPQWMGLVGPETDELSVVLPGCDTGLRLDRERIVRR